MSIFTEVVQKLISEGADPNDLQDEFEKAVEETLDWGLWGDQRWRKYMVCSKCGSSYAGVCSDDPKAKIGDFRDPTFHKNQDGITRITYKDWLKKSSIGA